MRHLRILTGFIAAVALVLAALVSAPGAQAESVAERAAAKPKHQIVSLNAGKVPNTKKKLFVKGRIATALKKRVVLQKAGSKRGKYRTFKGKRTTARGGFRIVFSQPIGTHIRLVIPETKGNRMTPVYVGKVIRKY